MHKTNYVCLLFSRENKTNRASCTVRPGLLLFPLSLSGRATGHICMPMNARVEAPLDDPATACGCAWVSSFSTVRRIKRPKSCDPVTDYGGHWNKVGQAWFKDLKWWQMYVYQWPQNAVHHMALFFFGKLLNSRPSTPGMESWQCKQGEPDSARKKPSLIKIGLF